MTSQNGYKKRVLYISPNGFLGGAEKFVLNIAKAHLRLGHYQPRIIFFAKGEAYAEAVSAGIDTMVLPFPVRLSRPASLLKTARFISQQLRSFSPGILHLTMPYSLLTTFAGSFKSKARRVWFQHGPVAGWMDRLASLLPVDLILFHSKYLQCEHNRHHPGRSRFGQKIIVAGLPAVTLDSEQVKKTRSDYLQGAQILIAMAGRICDWKGHDTFIEAIAILKKQFAPEKWHQLRFVIAGTANSAKDKAFLEKLCNRAAELGIRDDVNFTGYISDLQPFLAALDIFVHASKIPEPFGLVVAEAMQCGPLVIGSNGGGLVEILKEAETGYSFDSFSNAADVNLSQAIARSVSDMNSGSTNHKKLRERAQNYIRERHSLDEMCRQIENAYDEIYPD